MTDTPQDPPVTKDRQPYTVLLMMPDDIRADECCAADWIRRVWVFAPDPDEAIGEAQAEVARICDPEDLEVVAIYAGHVFDLYQP